MQHRCAFSGRETNRPPTAAKSSKINCFSMDTQNASNSESTPFVPMDMRSSPFMSGSWEVYEWLMSKQWVATATQRIILNSFTSFNYQHICHICFRVNTMTLNSYSPLMNSLESRNISGSWVTHENPQYIRFMSDCAEYHSRRSIWLKTFMSGRSFV